MTGFECDVAIVGRAVRAERRGAPRGHRRPGRPHLRPADVLLGAQHARRHAPALAVGRERPVAPRPPLHARRLSRQTRSRRSARRCRWTASSTTAAGSSAGPCPASTTATVRQRGDPRRAGSSSSSRTASRCARAAWSSRPGSPFAQRPPVFDTLRPGLVSHAVEHRDLRPFDGRRVVVAGGGQSALESAALLHEAGADVEVLVREHDIYWLTRRWQHRMPVVSSMLYAWPDVGPAGVSHLVARPALWRQDAARALRTGWRGARSGRRRGVARPAPRRRPDPDGRRDRGAEASAAGSGSGCPTAPRSPPTICCSAPATASTSRGTRSSPATSSGASHASTATRASPRLREHRARPALRRRARRLEPRPAHAVRRRGGLRGPLGGARRRGRRDR